MKILLATIGTFGDLNPYLALGEELARRGHQVSLAASQASQNYLAKSRLKFLPLRPHIALSEDIALRRFFDYERGSIDFMEDVLFPAWLETYLDLEEAVGQHDLFVSTQAILPAAHLAAATGTPWTEVVFAPLSMGRPQPPEWPFPAWVPDFNKIFDAVAPLYAAVPSFVEKLTRDPARKRRFGPLATPLKLGLFSKYLAKPQSYWQQNAKVTGFVFRDTYWDIPASLADYLATGQSPLVMALGSGMPYVIDASFYNSFIEAARRLKQRLVIFAGPKTESLKQAYADREDVYIAAAAPYGKVFPKAAAIIHHGGIGTLAQALQAGKPSLIVPFCFDQPMNAYFVEQLGLGRHLLQQDCTADKISDCLSVLLDEQLGKDAKRFSNRMALEDGLNTACSEIENYTSVAQKYRNVKAG